MSNENVRESAKRFNYFCRECSYRPPQKLATENKLVSLSSIGFHWSEYSQGEREMITEMSMEARISLANEQM